MRTPCVLLISSSSLHRITIFAAPARHHRFKKASIHSRSEHEDRHGVDESLYKQQKALLCATSAPLLIPSCSASRLATRNSDLHGTRNAVEDEDELEALARRVGSLPTGAEVRRVASTEPRRLKRIPPRHTEHGVVSNYVRTGTYFSLSLFSRFT